MSGSRRPRRNVHMLYRALYKKQDGKCWLCGEYMILQMGRSTLPHRVTLDHVIPRSLGGSNDASNLKLAHKICNEERGARLDPNPVSSRR